MKAQKHMKTTASLAFGTLSKYIDQLLAGSQAYKSYVTEEELATERERQEAAGETPRYINEYLGMSEEKKQFTLQNVKQQVSSQLFVWQLMSLVSTSGMRHGQGDIEV